ncbi:hypothetical protein PTTG_27539 [Puccinia triticina 1-1 BBBD Race 1]|uniref:Uncharacterized protein n=1 Tax=Puccinia triticina (isolate 1-1 / race 1 (BBBD)) TaxID=630390 RepID=A0A180GK00_PUCT1|nr:hypothetical protein PTTG_27539 [Puccinia triticina 1-1 BBBD Race 1]
MAETSQNNCATDTALAQPPKNGFEGLEAALPPLQEDFFKLPEEEPLPPDTGIPPALYHLRETSIALDSSRSTPVPRPIDREQMDLTVDIPQTSQLPSQPTNPEEPLTGGFPRTYGPYPGRGGTIQPHQHVQRAVQPIFLRQGGAEHVKHEAPPLPSFSDPRDNNRTCWEEQWYLSLSRMDTQRQATQPGSFINDSEQRPRTTEPYNTTNPAFFTASHSAARQSATYSSDANARTHGLSTITSYGTGVPGSYPLQSASVSATATISAAPREPELPRTSNVTTATAADAPSEAATSFYTARSGTIHTLILTCRKDLQTTTPLILKTTGEDQRGTGDAHGTTLRGF